MHRLHEKGEGKRQLKTQGSCKTGNVCIAHLKVAEDITTGVVNVEYCCTHTGHEAELGHLPVPEDVGLNHCQGT